MFFQCKQIGYLKENHCLFNKFMTIILIIFIVEIFFSMVVTDTRSTKPTQIINQE